MYDYESYEKYPHHRKWFNKLYVAETFGYSCGPCGLAPKNTGMYIVRPIYNLSGMGLGAKVKWLEEGDISATPPGYFWCEYLKGKHYSVDYEFVDGINPYWKPISCFEGLNRPLNLIKWVEWKKSDYIPEFPKKLNELSDVKRINVEFKGNDVIEVHLRPSDDPDYDHIIPVWKSEINLSQGDRGKIAEYIEEYGYKFIPSDTDADGFLEDPRIGFLVK